MRVDPDEEWVETAWDVISLVTGVESLVSNIQDGNVAAAVGDGLGVVLDAVAVVVPLVPGSVGSAIKAGRAVDKAVDAEKMSNAARREVMRKQGIPTRQQPKSQSKNASGREYTYEVPKDGEGTQTKSVQQQTKDRSHPGEKYWEAGDIKKIDGNTQYNNYGRPKIINENKSKVDY